LEHLEITENIPRDAVVFVKLDGDQKFKSMERAMGEEGGQEGPSSHFGDGQENGPGSIANSRTCLGASRLVGICAATIDR